ncbi:uncharacterized protein MONOS_18258 [Monocercomonoides exilis]|uniref:uncharacterized protein n=1 Tax=Monocercomonoides exilis TaxID=2049356 RepID=UPI00355AC081|nr:hypothetical protein MONOS_18258 [Monocercomonoides exilis]
MLQPIKDLPLIVKLFGISLLGIIFFSMINIFCYYDDNNAWIAVLGLYVIHQCTPSVLFVYIIISAFTVVVDIVRLIVFNNKNAFLRAFPYFNVMTIFGIVFKLASCVLGFFSRNSLETTDSQIPSTGPAPTAAYSQTSSATYSNIV